MRRPSRSRTAQILCCSILLGLVTVATAQNLGTEDQAFLRRIKALLQWEGTWAHSGEPSRHVDRWIKIEQQGRLSDETMKGIYHVVRYLPGGRIISKTATTCVGTPETKDGTSVLKMIKYVNFYDDPDDEYHDPPHTCTVLKMRKGKCYMDRDEILCPR